MMNLIPFVLMPLALAVAVTIGAKAMGEELAVHWGLFAGLFALITSVAIHAGV